MNRVAPAGESVLELALSWASAFRTDAPIALGAALEALDAAAEMPLDAGLEFERRKTAFVLIADSINRTSRKRSKGHS